MKASHWIVATTTVCLLGSCAGEQQSTPFLRSVYTTHPSTRGEESSSIYSGIVEESHDVGLGFKTAGQLKNILVEEGDFVRKGELLAELDDVDYQLAVDALQIQYDQLKDEVDRTTQLFEQRSISSNDYEKATAGLRQLGIQLEANKNKVKYTKLYAPTDGYIRSVNFSPAEMVDAGTAVFRLMDVSRLEVALDIPAKAYSGREHFSRFVCRAPYASDQDLPMTLLSLTPKADGNQLYRMRLAFAEQPSKQLTAGMNIEVRILSRVDSTGYTLPLCSIFHENDDSFVWVIGDDSTVHKRNVVLHGIDSEGDAVVASGLSGDETIVRAGVNSLQEGEKIRIIEQPSKTNVGGVL